jgi:hypothetical protein
MSKTSEPESRNHPTVSGELQARLVERSELSRAQRLLDKHHYLKRAHPVGERLYYVVTDAQGQWVALLVFNAAAKHLKPRDQGLDGPFRSDTGAWVWSLITAGF